MSQILSDDEFYERCEDLSGYVPELLDEPDESSIRHNVCPDSDEEGEEGLGLQLILPVRSGQENLAVGQVFFSRNDIHDAVLDHALKSGCNIKQDRYDTKKIGFCCVGSNCDWRLYCAITSSSDKWEVRRFNDRHSCVPNGECQLLKVPVIAKLFLDKIRDEPEYFMPMKIEALIKEKYNIIVSRPQCQSARNKALKWIEAEYDKQFERLRDFGAEILESNPMSSVAIETVRNDEGLDLFNRLYICYDVVKRAWKDHCRPVIGVDGCFLRGKMKGQLLVALGRDGNNAIYPLAWAVVQAENTINWVWFVQKIKTDLELEDGEGFVLVSDRQKGLIRAVEEELPNIEHRMYVRHIYANLKAKHGKKSDMKPLIWNLAWSYNEADFNTNLAKILIYDKGVYDDVIKSKPKSWCRAFYKIGSCCEDVDNNSTESFNATIVKAREKPLVPMLELISRQAMVRIAKRSTITINHPGIITPYAQEELALEFPAASECTVHRGTNTMYLVHYGGCSYRVSLASRTCSCRKWDIKGIPCEHAYGVIIKQKLLVENYVLPWFRTSTWRKTYEEGFTPSRGAKFWPIGIDPGVHKPPSPPQTGRKKKISVIKQKRKKGLNKSPTKKVSKVMNRVMHCSICGTANHNSRYHKKDSQSQGEP